jgi:hypothetical protein
VICPAKMSIGQGLLERKCGLGENGESRVTSKAVAWATGKMELSFFKKAR